jgi:hypothetical protein
MMSTMHSVLNTLSDGIREERKDREAMEVRLEDRLAKVEYKVTELKSTVDSLIRSRNKVRNRDSIRDMEKKVSVAQCALKLLDVNIGRETGDRREIVRKTLDEVRSYIKDSDLSYYDRVIRRTRITIMGKGTTRWEREGEAGFSVPTLFQCRDRRDLEELDGMLRAAGYFPSFHWPREMMEFVGKVRDEVRGQGLRHDSHYIRVRPETREGRLLVKAEAKPKDGNGRFVLKGLWNLPPLHRDLWEGIQDLYTNQLGLRNEAS